MSDEIFMQEDDLIVTKADLKGNIIYCNDTFLIYSNLHEEQVLGQPHSMVRHPDMPRTIFRLLWETVNSHNEFIGFIKNRCSDGRFYWSFAIITPSFDAENQLIGYLSVRRCPRRESVEYFANLYREMRQIEEQATDAEEGIGQSLDHLHSHIGSDRSYHEYVFSYHR